MANYSYISVLTGSAYFPGLHALQKSLKDVDSQYPLHVVIPENTDLDTKNKISNLNLGIIELPELKLDESLSNLNTNSRWNNTFFKLQIFNLTQFEKIVFLDLDMIVAKNIDHLFNKPHMSCVAAGKCIHPDWTRLNSGIMVIEPNEILYHNLTECIPATCEERLTAGLAYGDQDVLNYYYKDWSNHPELELSEIYNSLTPFFKEICKHFGYDNIHVIHFAEEKKPWQYSAPEMYKHILHCILKRNPQRAKMCLKYWKYIKK